MAENFYTILTNIGKAKIANATALGTKVNFTTLKVGDSNGTYYNPTETQKDLVHTVWNGNINSITTDAENPNWIVVEVVIPSNVGGFTVREVGIFDDEGDMLAIGKYPETYKPQVTDGSTKDITIRMILEVSNSASVTLKVDPTVTLATKADFNTLAGAGRTTQTVKGNADAIKAHKTDYEYQTPTIVNTQIQLIKKSDTKILKFKLDADLTGGNITMSTDAGATNKPLVDTDGTQVTSLEKGFVEVVADADFFILRNKGGISPGQKQDLIDIANDAEAYNSVIKTNIANSVNNKAGTSLNESSTWNDIKNAIGGITIEGLGGKKWASGTSSTFSFTVNNLTFQPKLIFVFIDFRYADHDTHNYDYYNLYAPYNLSAWGNGICINESNNNVENGISPTYIRNVNSNGFNYVSVINSSATLNQPIYWIAIE